ncbi:MAG: Phage portal protein BeeE [Chloroflexi bacterium]|jgi:HK97 family phage portal protein|nr:MAG: Phage portal protein BeeE [Chloroflexota bacterium]
MINALRDVLNSLVPQANAGVPAIKRGNEPLAQSLRGQMHDLPVGQEWAPASYGDYYAASVPVYRAVKLRADAVAQAPMKVYKRDNLGELSWVGPRHPVQQLLERVNPWWSHFELWRGVETHLNLWGSSFRWVNRPTTDPSTWEIWLLRPDKVAVVRDREQYVRGFIYDPHGARFPMTPDEVLWDRYFNPLDEYAGLSPIAPGRLSIDMQRDMLKVNRYLFKNGVLSQNLAFMLNGPLTTEQVEEFYLRLEERHGGSEKANRPIVVDVGVGKVENLGLSNREMEFFQGLTFTLQDVARIYSVPPPLMYDQTRATYNNVAEAKKDFYENAITQEWRLLEAGMQERFVPMLPPQYRDLEVRFDTSGIEALQEDASQRAQRDQADIERGIRTINEVRQERGLPQVPWGDTWWAPQGMTPARDSIGGSSRR